MARFGLRRKKDAATPAPPPPPPPPGAPAAGGIPGASGAPTGQPTPGAAPGAAGQPAQGAQAATGQTVVRPPAGQRAGAGQAPAAGQGAPTGAPVAGKPPTGVGPRGTMPPGTPGAPAATVPPRPTLEGLRSWVATLDRKLGLRTYIGAAIVILAIAAATVAIVLAIDARDNSANNDDLNAISERVNALDGGEVTEGEVDATSIESLEARLTALEDQAATSTDAGTGDVAARLDVVEGDIEELREQISDLEAESNP